MTGTDSTPSGDTYVRFGREELVIHRRYQLISITNDVLMALWFLIGSVMFFYQSLTYDATWFFTIGSAQFLVRPLIRLARSFHLKRVPESSWEM